jgi:acyl carrier protein
MMMKKFVVDAIHKVFPSFKGEITDETTASQVSGWDSFSHVELMFTVEDASGVTVDVEKTYDCENVGQLIEILEGMRA